ncbi:hypothetical protein PG989_003770 [Apiospora arundinis]
MSSNNIANERGLNPQRAPQRLYGRKIKVKARTQDILDRSTWTLLEASDQVIITTAIWAELGTVLRPLVEQLESREHINQDAIARDVVRKVFSDNLSLFGDSSLDELFDI